MPQISEKTLKLQKLSREDVEYKGTMVKIELPIKN